MEINELVKQVHQNAVNHGWWDGEERTLPEILMLCVSELAEALEEYRDKKPDVYYVVKTMDSSGNVYPEIRTDYVDGEFEGEKPEGWAVEMVDCVIRIMDYFGHEGLDLETILRMKHEYNKGRSYRHGGKVI